MAKAEQTLFDDALPRFAEIMLRHMTAEQLRKQIVLRDSQGRLTLVIKESISEETQEKIKAQVKKELPRYSVSYSVLLPADDDLLDPSLTDPDNGACEIVHLVKGRKEKEVGVNLIDRMFIGQDWANPNFTPIPSVPPLVSFFSAKGGVGRTTALAITASVLSNEGYNVLTIDMDLEAPGLSTVLLNKEDLPHYGLLDYLVERRFSGEDLVRQVVVPSSLAGGSGALHVVPVTGKQCDAFPQNVIPKLGHALIESFDEEHEAQTPTTKIRQLIQALCEQNTYDVVLVDARAGLSEATASALLGLGGHILMFGQDTIQTTQSYRFLLAYFRRYLLTERGNSWSDKLQMVHAKALPGTYKSFRDNIEERFLDYIYTDTDDAIPGFSSDDEEAPYYAWPIRFDEQYLRFDPRRTPEQLEARFFERSFGVFIEKLKTRILQGVHRETENPSSNQNSNLKEHLAIRQTLCDWNFEHSALYNPPGHANALDPQRFIVVGRRGAGKTFWANALVDEKWRDDISRLYPHLELGGLRIRSGFNGQESGSTMPPGTALLERVLEKKIKPLVIWKTVLLQNLVDEGLIQRGTFPNNFESLVEWAQNHEVELEDAMKQADYTLGKKRLRFLLVFDALDRLGSSWETVRPLFKGILELALFIKGYNHIKCKVFIRQDQFLDEGVWEFADSSKMKHDYVDLRWERLDLYGMLFNHLLKNKSSTRAFDAYLRQLGMSSDKNELPADLREDEKKQEALFHLLAGPLHG